MIWWQRRWTMAESRLWIRSVVDDVRLPLSKLLLWQIETNQHHAESPMTMNTVLEIALRPLFVVEKHLIRFWKIETHRNLIRFNFYCYFVHALEPHSSLGSRTNLKLMENDCTKIESLFSSRHRISRQLNFAQHMRSLCCWNAKNTHE